LGAATPEEVSSSGLVKRDEEEVAQVRTGPEAESGTKAGGGRETFSAFVATERDSKFVTAEPSLVVITFRRT